MALPLPESRRLTFGVFTADPSLGRLLKDGIPVKLAPQPFKVLLLLIERRGNVVTREEIREHLWGGATFVDFERGINFSINQIRGALSDEVEKPRYIETLPKIGYRFICPVEPAADEPSGHKAEEEGVTQGPKVAPATNHRRRMLAGTLVAVVIVLAGLFVSRIAERSRTTAKIRSVAVLPLENVSGNAAEDYFADSMTDELITELGRIQPLRVISRTSVMRYKGVHKSLPQIAQELHVDAIVEGTVLRSGEQVRITAQLIQASPEKHLWSRSYQREVRDVLGVQNEIAGAVAKQIQGSLIPQVQAALKIQRTANPDAYESYWKGEYFLDKATPESLQKAAGHFQDAIAKDPNYVAAYNKLAGTYQIMGVEGILSKTESNAKADPLIKRALILDPSSGAARAQRGWRALLSDLDFTTAGEEFRRAVELSPNGVEAIKIGGILRRCWASGAVSS